MKLIETKAELAIILGSGIDVSLLGGDIKQKIFFDDFEVLKQPTVDSHRGEIMVLSVGVKEVVVVKGRLHFYEGYSELEVSELTKLFYRSGIKKIILTNASGGINKKLEEGDLMLIEDQINYRFKTPLRGLGKNENNIQFPDMSKAYCGEMGEIVSRLARSNNIELKEGIYLGLTGPSLETKSEYKMAIKLGADCIGMSTVPEVIMAKYLGMKCLGISIISNVFNENDVKETSFESVLKTVEASNKKLSLLLSSLIDRLA